MKRFALSTAITISAALPVVAQPLAPAWVKLFSDSEGRTAFMDINRIKREGPDSYVVRTTLNSYIGEDFDVRVEVNCRNWLFKMGDNPAETNQIVADEYCQVIHQYSR